MRSIYRIAIVVSHPIQHFCPQYVNFAKNRKIELKVFFGSTLGLKKYYDPNFKKEISWSNLGLDQFQHEFVNGDQIIPSDKNLDSPALERALDNFKPDLIISYGYFQKLQRRTHRWSVKNKVPLAYISDSELHHKRMFLKNMIKLPFLYYYFSKITYFLSVGNANEKYYQNYGVEIEKLVRMHFPIDINLYEDCYANRLELRQIIRDNYKIKNDEILLSVVGKLVQWKNQDHIIDAMSILESKDIVVNLLVIGSGEMQKKMEEKALILEKSKVFFTGFVPTDKLPGYYAATDIYVHPASIEPHSIAISEAIYMGCPVILSSTCGSYGKDDDVQEGKNGWVYPFGNIQILASYMERLIKDNKERNEFGAYSHNIAVNFQNKAHHLIIPELLNRSYSKA